jgi:hypothetical protein
LLTSADGHILLRARRTGGATEEPASVGAQLAQELLHAAGGTDILEEFGDLR